MASENRLHIIIAGAGLAGLATARMLREHHDVTVYERGDQNTMTGGQGINMFPNAANILETVGFDRARAGSVPMTGWRSYDKQGHVVKDIEVDFVARYGGSPIMQMRSDFRTELLRLATAPSEELGISGRPAKLAIEKNVVDVNADEGIVTFSDGSTESADLVIAADGVHSRLRNRILGDDSHGVKKMGLTCYRVALDAERAREVLDGKLPHFWDPETGKARASLTKADDGTGRFVATYPLRHFEYVNLSCVFPTRGEMGSTTESWHTDGDRDDMVAVYSDFYESFVKLLTVAQEVKMWELQDLDPLPRWNQGRAIVIGDAAHAMTPLQGQGANMAIEDAEAFRLIRPGMTRDEIPEALKKIDTVRRPRAAKVLEGTRGLGKDVKLDDILARMDYNFNYKGVEAELAGQQ